MKIQVVRADGNKEVLTLTEPVTIIRGGLNRLVCSTGMEHWFTADGVYDGWGMDVSGSGLVADPSVPLSAQEAGGFIAAIENDREIEGNPKRDDSN
jgi:hypothetical protein